MIWIQFVLKPSVDEAHLNHFYVADSIESSFNVGFGEAAEASMQSVSIVIMIFSDKLQAHSDCERQIR